MVRQNVGPLQTLQRLRAAGDIKVTKAGEKWVAWVEPSVHITGVGESPNGAMKALVERLLHTEVHKA